MAALRQDLAYAFRSLRKQPGFTATAVLMLAIGIGANVAIFSLVHAVLVRPLPFADPDRLMLVHLRGPDLRVSGHVPEHGLVRIRSTSSCREHQQTFESLGAFSSWTWNITGSGSPERARRRDGGCRAIFDTLGIRPAVGRAFSADETTSAGSAPLAVLGDGLWHRRFGGSTDVIGRTIGLNGIPHRSSACCRRASAASPGRPSSGCR